VLLIRSNAHAVARWSLAATVGLVATLTFLSTASPATAGPWEDRFVAQCCYEKLESGSIEPQYFTLFNAGTEPWGAPGGPAIALGTEDPRNRSSEFATGTWANASRPVSNVAHEVMPGETYEFAFEVKAPTVVMPTDYEEHFSLVAEYVTWMDEGLGALMWLDYEVVPATLPTVVIKTSSSTITAGAPLTVEATATAAAAVNRVVLGFGGQEAVSVVPRDPGITADEQPSWSTSTTFSTASMTGAQTVVATAYSDAGLSATATATVSVDAPPPQPSPPPLAAPAVVAPFALTFGLKRIGSHGRRQLSRVIVTGASRGELASLRCAHCRGQQRLSAASRGDELTLKPHQTVLRPGSELAVYVTDVDHYGRYKLFVVKRSGAIFRLSAEGCLAPGSTERVACPS
jgi:hypothetical protein